MDLALSSDRGGRFSRGASSSLISPDDWARQLSAPPELSTSHLEWPTAALRRWKDTAPEMDQPPLDHHYVVQHLGGPKRVHRSRDGLPVSMTAALGSLTFVPAGTHFRWRAQGPIEFAHLYVSPVQLDGLAERLGARSRADVIDRIGCRDPLLESTFAAMLAEARDPGATPALYLDSLMETFLNRLIVAHTTARVRSAQRKESLPGFQVNRLVEYIEAHLDRRLALADLAEAAGASVFHFSRAFRNATGEAPHRFVLRRRVARARTLLVATDLSLEAVALACGFTNAVHFARVFTRLVGTTPSRYRRR